jgi:hypothetical protein
MTRATLWPTSPRAWGPLLRIYGVFLCVALFLALLRPLMWATPPAPVTSAPEHSCAKGRTPEAGEVP